MLGFAAVAAALTALVVANGEPPLPRWLLLATAALAGGLAVHEVMGRPLLLLRWSFLRMALGMKRLLEDWQVGDGREEEAARYATTHAPRGDAKAVIRAIDEYAYRQKFLMNVGDEKGEILSHALDRVQPKRALELGAYVGYSALCIGSRLAAGGHLYSVEFSPGNARIARRIVEHAGLADRVTIVEGSLGDGGKTMARLERDHGFSPGSLDFVFVDHAKDAYLPDLERILAAGWLHPGSVVVADNIGFPGAPDYREYMAAQEGKRWRTEAHATHVEYQSVIPDIVLESTLLVG